MGNGDYHLSEGSPCIDAGDNGYAQPAIPDMDGEYRVQNETIDIGADEAVADCTWYTISLTAPAGGHIETQVVVTGRVVQPPDTPIPNWPVTITVTGGTLISVVNGGVDSPTSGHAITNQSGEFTVSVQRDTPGYVTITAEAENACGTGQITDSDHLAFFDPSVPVEMFFCIDVTLSMWGYGHPATESIVQFLDDMAAQGVPLRLAGVKFNEGHDVCDDSVNLAQLTSLGSFASVSGFQIWLNDGYERFGGDWDELQLDALDLAAQDMNACSNSSNPRRYIVLITDWTYHYAGDSCDTCSILNESDVARELNDSGCHVYISLYEYPEVGGPLDSAYRDLLANDGEFDPCDLSGGEYPLSRLKTCILSLQ